MERWEVGSVLGSVWMREVPISGGALARAETTLAQFLYGFFLHFDAQNCGLLISRFGVRVPDGVLRKSFRYKDFRFFVSVDEGLKTDLGTPVGAPKLGLLGGGWGEFSGSGGDSRSSINAFSGLSLSSEPDTYASGAHDPTVR